PPTPVAGGGFTQAYTPGAPPYWHVRWEPLGALERATAGTTIAAGTHRIRGRYRADLTTAARLPVDDGGRPPPQRRVYEVIKRAARNGVTELLCSEVTTV